MSKAVAEISAGAGLAALVFFTGGLGAGLASGLAEALFSASGSLVLSGIGTLLTKSPQTGISGVIRNPIQPWNVIYGRAHTGGTMIFLEETGETNKYLHMVIVLACHPCEAVDALYFDGNRVTLDTDGNSLSYQDSTDVIASNRTVNIATITRVGNVVTVVLTGDMPLVADTAAGPAMMDGDVIRVHGVTTDATLNGEYPISVLAPDTFTYISGGSPASISSQGQATTTFNDYGDSVHIEKALGDHTTAFAGLTAGGDSGSNGLWTSDHKVLGHTSVYLRVKFGGQTYNGGLPSIGFAVRGKNDIYDPRTSPPSNEYSTNAALCIADYLSNMTWGFKAAYGTQIPTASLIAAANVCDEDVDLAIGGTEKRYTVNGGFPVTMGRGEVIQNMLTACAGRLTYTGGEFEIWPAYWRGIDFSNGGDFYSVDAKCLPWNVTDTLNTEFPYSTTGGIDPIPVTVTAGDTVTVICISGSTNFFEGGGFSDGDGDPDNLTGNATHAATGVGLSAVNFPTFHTDTKLLGVGGLIGAFADADGAVIEPLALGLSSTWIVPEGATQLLLGIDDQGYGDNSGSLNVFVTHVGSDNDLLRHLRGPIQWHPGVSGRDLYNGVKGTFISPANNWQRSDFPPYAQDADHGYDSDANLAEDGGDRRWLDMQLPFTISTATAQRLAKVELLRRRKRQNGTLVGSMFLYPIAALDNLSLTVPVMQWAGKQVEVANARFTLAKSDNDVTILGTELDIKETDSSVYDWSSSEEITSQGLSLTPIPTGSPATSVASPTDAATLSDDTTSVVGADGIARSRILVTWTPPADGFVLNGGHVEVQYRKVGDTAWSTAGNADPSSGQFYIGGLTDGDNYTVRLRSVNIGGFASAWTTLGGSPPITVAGQASTLPPGSLTQAGATSGQFLKWDGTAWVPASATGGGTSVTETPSGTQNGTNGTFTLSHTPISGSLILTVNGVVQVSGSSANYTISGTTITMFPPKSGDLVRATYSF